MNLKKIGVSILLLGSIVTLAACGNNASKVTDTGQAATSSSVHPTLQVAGKNFQGTHQGDHSQADPQIKTTLSFAKNGTFTRELVQTHGVAKHLVAKGHWQQTKGTVTLKVTAVTEEEFSSDAAVAQDKAATKIVQRSATGQDATALTATEAQPLKLTVKADHLIDRSQTLTLRRTNQAAINYDTHYTTAQAAFAAAQKEAAKHQLDHTTWVTTFAGTKKIKSHLTFNADGTYTRLSQTLYGGGDCYAQTDTGNFTYDPDQRQLSLTKTAASDSYHYKSQDAMQRNAYFEAATNFDTQGRMNAKLTAADKLTFAYFDDGTTTPGSDEMMTKTNYTALASPTDFAAQQSKAAPMTVKDLFPTSEDFKNYVIEVENATADEITAEADPEPIERGDLENGGPIVKVKLVYLVVFANKEVPHRSLAGIDSSGNMYFGSMGGLSYIDDEQTAAVKAKLE